MEMKNYLLVGIMALSMVNLSSCDEKIEGGDGEPDLSGKMEELTPSESKKQLQNVGVEFVEAINPKAHENLMEVIAYLGDEYAYYDVDEDYYEKLEDLYEEDSEYRENAPAAKPNPVAAVRGLMAVGLDAAQNGAQLATRATEFYSFTMQAGLKDLYGKFTPSVKKEEWKYDDSVTDRLEVEFTDEDDRVWVATLKGSEKTTIIHMTYEDVYKYESVYSEKQVVDGEIYNEESSEYIDRNNEEVDVLIEVPENITFVVKCGDQTVIDMTVDSKLDVDYSISEYYEVYQDRSYVYYYTYDSYWEEYNLNYSEEVLNKYERDEKCNLTVDYDDLSVNARLNVNGYEESWIANSNKQGGNTTVEMKIDGKSMLKYEASAKADIDALISQMNYNTSVSVDNYDDYYDLWENEEYEDVDASYLKSFSMYVDVMGKVQVVGKCESFEALYDAVELTEDEVEEYEEMTTKKALQHYVDGINQTFSIAVHYDKTTTVQATIEMEVAKYDSDSYGIEPVIVFACDDSRYSFEEYFEEDSFEDLIVAIEKLASSFEKTFNKYF